MWAGLVAMAGPAVWAHCPWTLASPLFTFFLLRCLSGGCRCLGSVCAWRACMQGLANCTAAPPFASPNPHPPFLAPRCPPPQASPRWSAAGRRGTAGSPPMSSTSSPPTCCCPGRRGTSSPERLQGLQGRRQPGRAAERIRSGAVPSAGAPCSPAVAAGWERFHASSAAHPPAYPFMATHVCCDHNPSCRVAPERAAWALQAAELRCPACDRATECICEGAGKARGVLSARRGRRASSALPWDLRTPQRLVQALGCLNCTPACRLQRRSGDPTVLPAAAPPQPPGKPAQAPQGEAAGVGLRLEDRPAAG